MPHHHLKSPISRFSEFSSFRTLPLFANQGVFFWKYITYSKSGVIQKKKAESHRHCRLPNWLDLWHCGFISVSVKMLLCCVMADFLFNVFSQVMHFMKIKLFCAKFNWWISLVSGVNRKNYVVPSLFHFYKSLLGFVSQFYECLFQLCLQLLKMPCFIVIVWS